MNLTTLRSTHQFDVIGLILIIPVTGAVGEATARWVAGGTGRARQRRKKSRNTWMSALSSTINAVAISFVLVLYPVIVTPYYRAADTTDFQRLLTVCLVHP